MAALASGVRRRAAADISIEVADGPDLLHVGVGQFDRERLLAAHDEFYDVEAHGVRLIFFSLRGDVEETLVLGGVRKDDGRLAVDHEGDGVVGGLEPVEEFVGVVAEGGQGQGVGEGFGHGGLRWLDSTRGGGN